MSEPRILFWDIESTHLRANFGYILCIGYKFLHWKKPKIIRIDRGPFYKKDVTDDRYVIDEFRKVHDTADITVTWYGDRFDYPMLRSRLIAGGLPIHAPVATIDLWKTARWQMNLTSNRLDTVAKFLDLPVQKTAVEGKHWVKATAGCKKSLKYIVDHCYYDIEVLAAAYKRMLPLIKMHPNVRLMMESPETVTCPKCNSMKIMRRGFKYLRCSIKQQLYCHKCGSWSLVPYESRRGEPQ